MSHRQRAVVGMWTVGETKAVCLLIHTELKKNKNEPSLASVSCCMCTADAGYCWPEATLQIIHIQHHFDNNQHLGHVSPKFSQLGHQLTERQLDSKLNSSFCFTNVRHVKSNLRQLTDDHAFSLAELPAVIFMINCCHGNTNRLYTCHSISQYSGIWKGVSGRVCVKWEAYQAVI